MTNSLTDTNPIDIITHIEQKFNRTQATGLNCLIFLALREQTTIAYQRKELGFEDIPKQIVQVCDALEEDDLLNLAGEITLGLLAEKITAALETERDESLAVQAIGSQNQPTLLSDY